MTTSWLSWIQLEQYCALHDIAVRQQGRRFRGPRHAARDQRQAACEAHAAAARHGEGRHLQIRRARQRAGSVAGSGKAGIHFNSSGMRGDMVKSAKFDWGEALLPYDPELIKSPLNSIIGGASLWTMTAPGRTPAEYKAVADVPAVHRQAGQRCVLAPAHRLCAGDVRRLRAVAEAGLLRQERRRRSAGEATRPRHGDERTRRGCGSGGSPRSATSSTRRWKRRCKAARPRSRRWTARSSRGNKVLRDFEKSAKA